MLQQNYATLRDLGELGVAAKALATVSSGHKKRAILAASGRIALYLRKRHTLPLTPDVTPLDTTGLIHGGTASLTIGSPGPAMVQDIAVQVFDPGTVGIVGVTVQVSVDAGTTYGPLTALALTGDLTIDGVTLTLAGPLAAGDMVEWSTRVDFGLCEATISIAAYLLVHNRGVDPVTMEDLEKRWEKAIQWSKDLASGEAFLDNREDATPELDEGGSYGDGQQDPWDFLDVVVGS